MAGALAQAADFSYSFVPTRRWNTPWSPVDVRQGRVLLLCFPDGDDGTLVLRDLEVAICDPLYRRYVLLPPIPDHLSDLHEGLSDFGILLAPTVEDEGETSFRVVCTVWTRTQLFAFVFASITGQWIMAASPTWASLGTDPPHFLHIFARFDFARGCFYRTNAWRDKVIVLDALRMEFSIVNNKPSSVHQRRYIGTPHVVVGEEGSPLMFFFSDVNDDGSGGQLCAAKVNDRGSSFQCQMENIPPLPRQYAYAIIGAEERFLFLDAIPEKDHNSAHPWGKYKFREYFSLDVRTSELKKVCEMKRHLYVQAYFGFPPSLSKPCI